MPLGSRQRNVCGAPCRGRRPRRPAGGTRCPGDRRAACPQAAAEGSRPLPTMQTKKGGMPLGRGPGMPGPYSAAQCVGAVHLVGGGVLDAPQGGTHFPAGRRGRVKTPPYDANRKGGMPLGRGPGMPGPYSAAHLVGGGTHLPGDCRGRRPRRPAGGTHSPGDRRAACPQAAAEGSRPFPTMQNGKGGCR